MSRRSTGQCFACWTKRPEIEQPADPTKRAIALTLGKIATIDLIDYERVAPFNWAAKKSKRKDGTEVFYAVRSEYADGKWHFVQMHRFILGVTDPKVQIDHKKPAETLNNCRDNLRDATPSLNQANRLYYENNAGYKGVETIRKKPGRRNYDGFRGVVTLNGKRMVSPIFREPEPAARWYDEQARERFGEFARVNFPEVHS
jgi:hypothetical protein